MFDSDLDLGTAAYHEAGHACLAHLLGGEVVLVTIECEEDEQLGRTTVEWPPTDKAEQRRRSALVALAGPMAEARWTGGSDTLEVLSAWRADWLEVENVLATLPEAVDRQAQMLEWLRELRAYLSDPAVWELLCRIADALEAHGTLDDALFDDAVQ